MKLIKIKNTVLLFVITVVGFLVGIWLSPQEPITSFLPTKDETMLLKDAVRTLAFITGVVSSILAFVGGHILRLNSICPAITILVVGLLYNCIDIARFGELTMNNLIWFIVFMFGLLSTFLLKTILMFFWQDKRGR